MNKPTYLDCAALTRVSGQLGSNPAGVYEDAQQQRYYIKTLESLAHARNEFIAAQLYRLAGVPTLCYHYTKDPLQVATRWVSLDSRCVKHLSPKQRLQAQQWFAVHAWTANWDVAGYNGDNQGVLDNQVVTLDVGGALSFRAMGDPKGSAFSERVNEITSLREDGDNPHACALFADMTPAQLLAALQVVLRISDEQISVTISENGGHAKLVRKMLARKRYLRETVLPDILLKQYTPCSPR